MRAQLNAASCSHVRIYTVADSTVRDNQRRWVLSFCAFRIRARGHGISALSHSLTCLASLSSLASLSLQSCDQLLDSHLISLSLSLSSLTRLSVQRCAQLSPSSLWRLASHNPLLDSLCLAQASEGPLPATRSAGPTAAVRPGTPAVRPTSPAPALDPASPALHRTRSTRPAAPPSSTPPPVAAPRRLSPTHTHTRSQQPLQEQAAGTLPPPIATPPPSPSPSPHPLFLHLRHLSLDGLPSLSPSEVARVAALPSLRSLHLRLCLAPATSALADLWGCRQADMRADDTQAHTQADTQADMQAGVQRHASSCSVLTTTTTTTADPTATTPPAFTPLVALDELRLTACFFEEEPPSPSPSPSPPLASPPALPLGSFTPSLSSLSIDLCVGLSAPRLAALLSLCPLLRRLSLRHLPAIVDDAALASVHAGRLTHLAICRCSGWSSEGGGGGEGGRGRGVTALLHLLLVRARALRAVSLPASSVTARLRRGLLRAGVIVRTEA